jgi:DegV family protein with EDD domain
VKPVAVVTDSTATVPPQLAERLGIHVVPVLLIFGSQSFRDGVDITPSEVYARLRAGDSIPTSAAPSVGDFVRTFAAAGQDAGGVLSIHMSPQLSATYNVALTATGLLDHVPVQVFNCNSAAMGQGFVVLEAARAAAAGASLDEVAQRAQEVAARVNLLFTLDTFKYLRRGGRIGGAAALAGTLLQIRPVLCIADGVVGEFARTRTKARALRVVLDHMAGEVAGRPLHAAVVHADVPDEAESLRQVVAASFECAELLVSEFTPVMGAHTGPGLLGIAYHAE